jgi:hypothetical protein
LDAVDTVCVTWARGTSAVDDVVWVSPSHGRKGSDEVATGYGTLNWVVELGHILEEVTQAFPRQEWEYLFGDD